MDIYIFSVIAFVIFAAIAGIYHSAGLSRMERIRKEIRDLRYNEDLANRFVSDYRLPVSVTGMPEIFFHQLRLYEEHWHAFTLWKELNAFIDEKFGGDQNRFLDTYYKIRDEIITNTEDSDAYKKFNSIDMKQFEVKNRPAVTSNNIYNGENVGKCFLSIDLRKANFQALRWCDPGIVLGADTYEDFIGKFTDLDYVKKSKYTRQVVFGKLNPKRHITVEKFLIAKVWECVRNWQDGEFPEGDREKMLVSMSNDEIVLSCESILPSALLRRIEAHVKESSGLDVKAESFLLTGWQLKSARSGHTRVTFYAKNFGDGRPEELTCVPGPYHAVVWKLYHGLKISDLDRHFVYEKIDSMFCEDFFIEKLK